MHTCWNYDYIFAAIITLDVGQKSLYQKLVPRFVVKYTKSGKPEERQLNHCFTFKILTQKTNLNMIIWRKTKAPREDYSSHVSRLGVTPPCSVLSRFSVLVFDCSWSADRGGGNGGTRGLFHIQSRALGCSERTMQSANYAFHSIKRWTLEMEVKEMDLIKEQKKMWMMCGWLCLCFVVWW